MVFVAFFLKIRAEQRQAFVHHPSVLLIKTVAYRLQDRINLLHQMSPYLKPLVAQAQGFAVPFSRLTPIGQIAQSLQLVQGPRYVGLILLTQLAKRFGSQRFFLVKGVLSNLSLRHFRIMQSFFLCNAFVLVEKLFQMKMVYERNQ